MDVPSLLQLLLPRWQRGKRPEGANNCQDIDRGSCHSADATQEMRKNFIVVLHYCKQVVLKHLEDTVLDFILLFREFDDERFSPINSLYALGSLAFKQANIEYLGNVQTFVIENYDSPDARFLMNDLGVMLSIKGMYERSGECFSKAKEWFQQEEDHLKNAVVTLNLAALYMILGDYKKACDFCNDAADLCHDITMRSAKDTNLPMKVLRRTADLLSECGNFEKCCLILRIGGKYNFGARKASKIDVRKWLMELQLKEQTGEKIEEQELKDCSSYLLIFLEKPDEQALNADLIRTVFTAARINHRNGLREEALKLLDKLEAALLLSGGRKDPLYGLMLFQVGRFKYGCGMTINAENDLKQADAILIKHFGRNHLVAYCKKLLGSCAMLNNNFGDASTNLAEALTFFQDLNSQHFEVADISLKLAQLQIEERNFEHTREILLVNSVQKALEMHMYSFGEISPTAGSAHVQAGLILQKVDKGAAIDQLNKAFEIYRSLGIQLYCPVIKLCQSMTGLFQLCLGNKEEAEKCFVDSLKESPVTDESYHDVMNRVDNLAAEFSTDYFKERPLYQSAKMFSLVSLVVMKKGKDDRQKYLDALVRFAEESDTEEQGIIDFAGYCCFVSHISCLAGPNVYVLIFPDPEFSSQFSNYDEVMISRFKNSSCILFWRTSCKIQEMKELRNLNFQIRESVSTLFLQPKFRKNYEETHDFYLELPLRSLSLCFQIDCLPLLVEIKLGEPGKECANFDCLTSWALQDSSSQPAVHVSYLSYEFSNKRTAELAFDSLVFSSSKEPILNDVKVLEVADGHSPHINFAFFASRHSRYCHFSVFVDEELPVLRVKSRHLNETNSNGFCFSVQSALENVMLSLYETFRISFEPLVQLSCEGCRMVGIKESSNVNCSNAVKTESSITSPQSGVFVKNCGSDSFTKKELNSGTKHLLNRVTCRDSLHCEGSNRESSTRNCGKESNQKPFSSNKTSLDCASAEVLESDFHEECHVSTLQNQEIHSGSHADVCLCLLEYLLSDTINFAPEHEALNSVIPQSDSFEEHSFLSSEFLSASSLNSLPATPDLFASCHPFTLKKSSSASSTLIGCIGHRQRLQEEPCECSEGDLADGCPATAQSKPTSKETHQYAEVCQFKTELKEKEIAVSLGDPFNLKKSTLASKLQEEPCECSDEDLAAGCLAKAQSKPETKETHHYADVFQLKTELNGKENPDNCDSIDGVPKRPEEPLGESYECPDMHIKVQHHPQCQRSLEEMKVSASNGIGVRNTRNIDLDPVILSKTEESATFQNNSFELLEQINELQEQLRQREAENQQLRAEVGRYLFLEDREKRSGKLLSVPREIASDESISWRASASFKCGTTNGRLLGGAASLQDNPDLNLQARFIDISNSLSPEEFKQMKILARDKLNGFRLAKMKVGFELLKEVERVSEHPCTDIGELLKGIQRFDLLEKLGLPYPESKTSESVGTSSDSLPSRDERLQDLEQGEERCATRISKSCTSTIGFANRSEDNGQKFTPDNDFDLSASVPFETDSENPMSINIENNDHSVGSNSKDGISVPVSCDQSGPSSGASTISVSASNMLALCTAEGTPVCSSSSSQESSEMSAKAPELSSTTNSAAARGEIVNESDVRLNTGSSEEEVPGQAQLLNSTDDVTDGGNTEFENFEGQSADSCYGVSRTTGSDRRRSPCCVNEYDSPIISSDSSAFCPLTEPVRSHVDDGNPFQLQQSSNAHCQTTLRMHESDESSSSATDWERLGARPKISQIQRPQVAISPPPPPPIASPVSDGLAGDFLVRHSQDKAVHESMFSNEQAANERSHNADLAFGRQSLANGYHEPGTSTRSAVIVDNSGLPSPFSVSTCCVSFSRIVAATTSRPPVVNASNNTWTRNRNFSSIAPGDGNAAGTSLAPVSGNSDENNSRGALLNRDIGTNYIEAVNDLLIAFERLVAHASALVEQMLREREERAQFRREIESLERMIRERRERERREREEREIQEAERWLQEQEATPMAL
ncbi:uncharacterized protein [Montipora foliosa]